MENLNNPTITIVSPCFNEENNVRACYEALLELFQNNEILKKYKREHIFVDNASTDTTVSILTELAENDPAVKVIVNARNYGPFRSTFNALRFASGDATVPMFPVDLQDPPEIIVDFVKHWENGAKRVYGVRTERQEGALLHGLRKSFYWMVNKFSDIHIPKNVTEFQIIDRQILDALIQYKDYYPYIRGMLANIGFNKNSVAIPYTWQERRSGISKNNFFHLIDQAINGLISFSSFPMRATVFLGFFLAFLSVSYAFVQLLVNLIMPDAAPSGIASIIIAIFFFSGVQLFVLGIIGEYVAAIHSQVRHGDIVVEEKLINLTHSDKRRNT